MTKYYLVVEDGYEYDDENYYKSESEGYSVETKLIKDKNVAQRIADQKNDERKNEEYFTDYEGQPIRPYHVIELEEDDTVYEPIVVKKKEYNLNLLTAKWFQETFERISEEESNSETLEAVKVKSVDEGLKITFHVDCGRYGLHRHNDITVYKNGKISINLAEIIESSGIPSNLEEAIDKLLS